MNKAELDKLFKSHTESLKAWIEEEKDFEERKEIMDTFIEQHQLPIDATIGQILEYCRKNTDV